MTSSAPPCFSSSAEAAASSSAVAGLQGCVQDLETVDVHRSCRLVGQARRLEVRTEVQLRNSVWRHCEVHLGRARRHRRPRSCRTMGRRRCRPLTCTPRSWRPCRAGSGRQRGALGPGSSCRCARCSTGSPPGSGCSRPHLLPRCAWPGPRCSRCWGGPSDRPV